jgi:tartrate dehydrogenase/decarboxylase / D-malate dehydrogenase
MKKIGLIVGGGSGPELGLVFRQAIEIFLSRGGLSSGIIECNYHSKSFTEMKSWTPDEFERAVETDIEKLLAFYRSLAADGVEKIFRTAVNAEALYALRIRMKTIKTATLNFRSHRVLFVRDLTEGFYASDSWKAGDDGIEFKGSFSKERFTGVVNWARAEAQTTLRPGFRSVLFFKHHLFANVLLRWTNEIDPSLEILQPGAGLVWLNDYLEINPQDLLIVAGNEIGDFLHEMFLGMIPFQGRAGACARSVFLTDEFAKLVEYQTIHGSADDVAGSGRVNPVATLRAAAGMAQRDFGVEGITESVETGICRAVENKLLTQKLEMTTTTDALVKFILDKIPKH